MSTPFSSTTLFSGLLLALAAPATADAQTGGKFCEVTIDRDYADGTFYVTRQTLANGDCVCYVQTGARPQSSEIEGKVMDLRRQRQCDNADAAITVPAGHTAVPAPTSGLGKFALVAALAGAGVVIATGSDSDSPASP